MSDKPKVCEYSATSLVYRGKRLSALTRDELIAAFIENDRQHRERIADLQNAIDVLVGEVEA